MWNEEFQDGCLNADSGALYLNSVFSVLLPLLLEVGDGPVDDEGLSILRVLFAFSFFRFLF